MTINFSVQLRVECSDEFFGGDPCIHAENLRAEQHGGRLVARYMIPLGVVVPLPGTPHYLVLCVRCINAQIEGLCQVLEDYIKKKEAE